MSERTALRLVLPVVNEVRQLLEDACEWFEVGGSVRRGAASVKDVELVAIAGTSVLARLDRYVASGLITKALYGEKRLPRWGEKYRGFEFEGIRFELFLTDRDSLGYIWWLRTGPGDANLYVMDRLKSTSSPVRAADGAIWHDGKRLCVPDEREMFRLLGMPYLQPVQRSEFVYRSFLSVPNYPLPETFTYAAVQPVSKPKQQSLL